MPVLQIGDTKPCGHCGDPIEMRITRDLTRKKYCSTSCRQKAAWRRGLLGERLAKAQQRGRFADKRPTNESVCDACGEIYLPINGRQRWCMPCVPDRAARGRMQRYGISQPQFSALLEKQGGGCALCGSQDRLVVDHDHDCCSGTMTCGACVRGILCGTCNMKLAAMEADPAWVSAALCYIGGRNAL